ncbi:serine hydrolase domain-containing protein [Ureibacillus sinduriensis]|uniref:Beta-lactamase n=1 Tax=Ureibacillus sinduriensis BLB-1 = JCM 15800 TaxID=1384057 RepID=A0A0A3I140_9BACL|nr:serine hydrolase domain-containing protein [Ureibacillus sinduriensis]KGR76343.1 beta-lactamase [Ureibacillus sinduriensis BLB-1 = JCM 15800]
MRKVALMLIMLLGFTSLIPEAYADSGTERIEKIEQFVEEQMGVSQIPGISVVIVEKGKTVYQNGFGYADVQNKVPVTSSTLFELASTSKAFTGLAILKLEEKGLLKRTDDVRKYIPWLKLQYKGEVQTITINQLLHHTSGIASNTIVDIPKTDEENALELTVRSLLEKPLNREPGSSFQYATINYDVLGLVIENATKQPYEVYMKELLEDIGMKDSYVGRHHVESGELATGYKRGFKRVQEYTPPAYRGNIPAGYIISSTNDISKWLNLQLGATQSDEINNRLIQESHIPDQSVNPFDLNTYYASGWSIMEEDEKRYIFHAGENPTFSSFLILQPEEQVGMAILSNMNSSFTTAIGQGVMDLWEGNEVNLNHTDSYQQIDNIVTLLSIFVCCVGVLFSYLFLKTLWKVAKKQRAWIRLKGKKIVLIVIHTLFVGALLTALMVAPATLLEMTWDFIKVWGPTSITVLYYSVLATAIVYYLFVLVRILTRKETIR